MATHVQQSFCMILLPATVSAHMNIERKPLQVLTLACLLLFFHLSIQAAEPQMDWRPPAFAIENTDGSVFRYPQDLQGKTIVFFWASWCPYCKALMPHLQSILDEFPGEIEVLALDFRDDQDPAELLAEYGYDFRLLPKADAVAAAWGVKATPGLFLADKSGRVVFDILRIPPQAFEPNPALNAEQADPDTLKHYQKASRRAPVWAAQLRMAIDRMDH